MGNAHTSRKNPASHDHAGHDHDDHDDHAGHDHDHAGHDHDDHAGHAHDDHAGHDHDDHAGHDHDDHDHDDHAGHAHGFGHVHSHAEGPRDFSVAFAVGISLNLIFVLVEVVYGLISHSMALVADAGHNLGDVLGLGLSWGALLLAQRRPTQRRTYGLRATTILASLANGLVLLVVTGGVLWESIRRILAPEPVGGMTVIVVALVGVAINGLSALLFMAGRKGDLNIRSAFLHLASDAGLALGVAIAGGVMLFTGWNWLDPVVSIVLSLAILAGTWSLLRQSVDLLLGSVPEGIDPQAVRAYLLGLPGVVGIHDLHIWAVSTTETALTAHLIAAGGALPPGSLDGACEELNGRFRIARSTLQVEAPAATPCRLAAEEPGEKSLGGLRASGAREVPRTEVQGTGERGFR